jgi:hypothetical protein
MILWLLQGFHAEGTECEPAGATDQRLDTADLTVVFGVVETDLGGRKVAALGPGDEGLGEWVVETIEVNLAGTAGQLVASKRDVDTQVGR